MTTKKMWLFTITGHDETEIHGKSYRVAIKKIATKSKVRGSVRNIKYSPEIEVRVATDEKEAAEFKAVLEQDMNEGRDEGDKLISLQ